MNSYIKPEMPDVATSQPAQQNGALDWVGMSRIALPLQLEDKDMGTFSTSASVDTFVNLINPQAKGIHMSRLYLLLAEFARKQVMTVTNLSDFLQKKLASHADISNAACLQMDFDYLIDQPALKSEYSGWKDYAVSLNGLYRDGQASLELSVTVPYSSTCPCSAALSRQLLQQAFSEDFAQQQQLDKATIEQWLRSERGSVATPHSQRSYAQIRVALGESDTQGFPIYELIHLAEATLKTAVQTAVKREDEQEFARLNGANQMFCEDAARRLQAALSQRESYRDFWVRVEHIESLHAHNAVAITTKGIAEGYQPLLHR